MPLSNEGIGQIGAAASDLAIDLDVLDASELYQWQTHQPSASRVPSVAVRTGIDSTASALIAAGATVHFPSIAVYRDGRVLGTAILGYKTSEAYAQAIARRLARGGPKRDPASGEARRIALLAQPAAAADATVERDEPRDFPVQGPVGVYFRWVPGTMAVAYEMKENIYLLDLATGSRSLLPGYIDFIPSPDGRFFVTPARDEAGLQFYDARAVLRAASRGKGADVRPVFVDTSRPDQYPSVGLLGSEVIERDTVKRYRVLTSWFERAAFRDYTVTIPPGADRDIVVRPAGPVVHICPDHQVSLPIISKDGDEIGGRDESTGTTKLFALRDDGRCDELLDLGLPTGKIAFDGDAHRIAFAVPPGAIAESPALHGIFTLDRERLLLSKVPGSEEASRLAFPEFVADAGIVFLIVLNSEDWSSLFRLVPRPE